jgi:hypothetical protein
VPDVPAMSTYKSLAKLSVRQRTQRLQLSGLLQSLGCSVRLNDLRTTQRLRARLSLGLRHHQSDLAKPLHDNLKELFAISGLWVRNVGNRHDTQRQIRQLIRYIMPRLNARWHAARQKTKQGLSATSSGKVSSQPQGPAVPQVATCRLASE